MLVACATSNDILPTTPPAKTISVFVPKNRTPNPTKAHVPTHLQLPTWTPVSFSCATDQTSKLSEAVLSASEIPIGMLDLFGFFNPTLTNSTTNFAECDIDCIRVTFSEIDQQTGRAKFDVTITLLRMENPEMAEELASRTWGSFIDPNESNDVEVIDKDKFVDSTALPQNRNFGIRFLGDGKVETIFVGSKGPLFAEILHENEVFGDYVFNFGSIQYFADLQMKKLDACYID